MSNTIPDVWTISGNVFEIDGFTPFTRGTVMVFDAYDDNEHHFGHFRF